ncbi:unnamed protein product [Rangifer tarandus platyrhynchus]|uniref:Uncharacterized protein n=1 Tax=Rangifer tarandus platyrhynchus TaxID=3082113 RepID=A0ABN8ZKQ4_RANTA|nr:unnamed protein product [Rangifer tarandus platyrhynchus]
MNLGQGQRMTASWVLLDRRTGRNEPPGQKEQPEQSSLWRRVPQRDHAGAPASFPGSCRGPLCRDISDRVVLHCGERGHPVRVDARSISGLHPLDATGAFHSQL